MKVLRLSDGIYIFEEVPSRSFVRKLAISATEKIGKFLPDVHKSHLTDIFELRFEKYQKSYKNKMILSIEAKNTAFVINHFVVVWKSDLRDIVYPWEDVSNISLKFEFVFSQSDINVINRFAHQLYFPITKAKESGLPFDYQLKSINSEGKLVFTFSRELSKHDIAWLNDILNNFHQEYNKKHEEKISYIGQIVLSSPKRAVTILDGGGTTVSSITECIHAFKECSFIKKIVFQ